MKKFVMGLILGVGIMFSVSVYAEEVVNYMGAKIEGQFDVKVNGQKIDQPALVVNGTSYLPVRTIAEMFGAEVKFDADLGIELISSKDSKDSAAKPSGSTSQIKLVQQEYERVVDELAAAQNKELELRNEINRIKTNHETKGQDTSDLENKLSEYEAKIKELTEKKYELEAQLTQLLKTETSE